MKKNLRIVNIVIQDFSDPKETKSWIVSYAVEDYVEEPEKALRNAVLKFIKSGSEEAKSALDYACGCFNWDDVMSSVPDSVFIENGLMPLNENSFDIFVDHDEILCDQNQDDE
ncbi:MAG: hypothetical protein LBI03_03815 [Clostridiales bacterium]|nr:hypothetical protein [Clostridiales bacterium]